MIKAQIMVSFWIFPGFLLIIYLAVTSSEGWSMAPLVPEFLYLNKMVEFVYYPQKIPWIAARRVCQSLGGDFAKIDSEEHLNELLHIARVNYGYDIFIEEYWIGLVEIEENLPFWVSDCSNLTFTSMFTDIYDSSRMCYRLRRDHVPERRMCHSNEGFMCEYFSEKPCPITSKIYGEILSVWTNISSCSSKCSEDNKCWGTVELTEGNCMMFGWSENDVHVLNVETKSCLNLTLNTTLINPDETGSDNYPNATCGPLVISPTQSNSTSNDVTPIEFPLCKHATSNESEMITSTSTIFFTVTSTVLFTSSALNITTEQAEEKAKEIVKNLTIKSKSTSSYIRRHISAEDRRQSAMFMGCIGIICVVVPLGFILTSDVQKVLQILRCQERPHRNFDRKLRQMKDGETSRATSYGVYMSQLVRLKQRCQYHKLRKNILFRKDQVPERKMCQRDEGSTCEQDNIIVGCSEAKSISDDV